MFHDVPLLFLLLPVVRAAGVVEDHAASWAAAGLESSLAAGYEAALPEPLFGAVTRAAPIMLRQSLEGQSFTFGKKNTWWLPLRDDSGRRPAPRAAIEMAVFALYDLVIGTAETPIIGAEWWIQEQGPSEGIGFHYDKDEAYASEHMTMRFPEVSTITYLSDVGSPTLILNQTTPDGNKEVPPLPKEAVFTHPAANKHVVFRGNLHHGVHGDLSRWALGAEAHGTQPAGDGRRRTLLINWWRYMPMPPNCVHFESERWARVTPELRAARATLEDATGGGGDGGGGDGDSGGSSSRHAGGSTAAGGVAGIASTARAIVYSELGLQPQSARQIAVELPPTELLHLSFPPPAEARAGNWHIVWDAMDGVGPLTKLDLHHQRSLNAIFADARPKLFLVLSSKAGGAVDWVGALPKWLVELHASVQERLRIVLADPATTADFMKQFGLSHADVPTLAIHDTARGGAKYTLREKLRKKSAWRFVNGFLAGTLPKDEL